MSNYCTCGYWRAARTCHADDCPAARIEALEAQLADARAAQADAQRTAWLILRSVTFDGGYVAIERTTIAEFDPGKAILESWEDARDGTHCFRAALGKDTQ